MSAAFPCRPAGFLQLFFLVSILFLVPSIAAPVTEDLSQTEQGQISEYYGGESKKCYYNFQHYEEGDRIITNEPCLNCTCHKRMLMCYLRVCPFTKAIGQDCKVEKKPDQCCPVITCPEVPVQLLTSSTTEHPTTSSSTKTAVAHPDNHGCRLENNSFYPDGAQLPIAPNNPCELCYCIRNRTACVMQECTLNVEGCRPVYQDGVCCPVRYDCDYYDVSTTERPTTGGLQLTPTPVPLGCRYGNTIYNDGEKIETDKPCESCYCMRGDIVCAVRSCGTPLQGKNCEPLPPPEGECCPTNYKCANGTVPVESLSEETATASTYTLHVDDASTDHPEQQLADNVEHDFPEHNGEEEEVHEEKPSAPSEPETESSTSITSDSEKPTDQTAETAQHEEQVQQVSQVEEEIQKPSFDEKPGAETEEGHIEQIHGDESTGKPEEEDDSNLSTSAPVISENIPSDSVSGLVTKPHESESAQTDIKIDSTVIPDEYSGIEESIKNNTIQTIITELLHPEEQKPFDVNNLVTSSPETAESQTGDKEGETDNKSEDSEATTATSQDKIFHSPDSTSSSVPIESASSVLKPEDENIIKGQEPEKSDENAAVTTDQGEHLQKPASAESDNIPVQSEGSVTESEQTKPEHPVQTESDDSVIKPDESSSEETPVIPDQSTHIEAEEGQTKPEEPLHVETTAHPGVPESDEAEAVKPEEPSVDTPAVPAEESSIEQQTAEEPSVETQTAETGGDETKLGEPLHGETSVVPEQPSAATEIVETGSKPEESPIESSVLSEHAGSKDSDEGVDKPEEPSTVVQSAAPEQPATEGSEDISTSEYPSVTSSAEDDQVPVESHQMATKPEESSSEIPQQSAQHESESTAQPEVQDGTEKPETSETLESETVETKPEEHTTAETASSLDQQAAIESDHTEQVPEKTSHDETGHQPSPDSNEVAAKPEEVVPFVGIPAIPELPSTIVSDEAESNQEEHIETTALPEQQAPIESEAESTAMEHPASAPSDDISGKPEETPATTEHVSDVESDESTAKPDESPEQTQTLDKTEQPVTAESDESAQKPEEPQEVHSETTDEIPQQPSAVESDDVSIKPEDSVLGLTEIPSLKPHEDTATESIDILKTSEINKPQEVEESSKPEYKPEENIIVSDSEGQDVSGDAHLHPTESSQGEGVTESDQSIQAIKPEEGINQIPEDSVKPEDNKVEDSTEHEAGVLQEHVQSPAVSDETGSEQEIIDATDKPAAEDIEAVTHPTSDVQHEVLITDSENAVATELSEGEKPAEVKPQDEGNIEGTPEIKPETPESNVIHDNEQNVISETNTADPVDNVSEDSHVSPVDTSEQTSESDAATTAKSDISEGPVELDESQKPDTIKESSESTSSEESGASSESDTAAVESSTLQGADDESPAPSSESQELPTIPEDAQEPEKNIPEGEDTNQIPEQSFDSQSTSQEDTTTDKDQTSVTHVSEDTDKPSKTDIPMPSVDEEPPNPLESDQGELQTHVESNNAEVPIVEDKDPEKHDSETVAPEADESSKPEESTSVNVLPEKVKPDETSESSQHELPVDSENQLHNEKPSAPELVNEPSTGEDALSPNEIPDATVPIHGGAIDIESIAQHLPGPTGILTPESEQGIIPGEGSCLVDDVTYSNNSKIPSSSQCHKECVCISSIVHCIGVDCPPPPHLSNCMPIQQGPDSCCPMYACDGETPTLLESHSQIGDSDSSKQPVKGSDSAPQHETPESPKKPVEIQTVEPAHDESSVTVHGDVVPDHVESDSASSQSVHEPDTSEAVPEKPVDTPEHPLLPALPVPENVEQDFIPEQPSDHEGADVTENQAVSETLPQEEHTETHDSVGEHEIPDSILEQQTSSPEPSDDTKESDKVSDTSGHITESSTTDEKIPETPVTDTSFVQSVPSEESATAVISEEPASIDETAVESKPSEAPEGTPAPTESEVPASPEQPIHDTSSDHEETKPAQEGGEVELPVQSQETPSNVPPSQDTVESTESSEQPASPEESAVTDSIVQHEIASEDISTPITSQEGEQATAESGDTHPLLGVDKPSSVKFESADTELTRPEDSSEPVKSDQESSTVIEAVEPTQQSTVESEQPSISHEDEVPELPQEAAEDVQQSTDVDSSKLSEVTTPSVDKDEFPEHSGDSHAIVTDANKIDSSAETVHEDATAAQKPDETDISVTQTPVDLGISKPEETSPESVDQEATATQAHSEQPSVSHDATPVDADHAQSISEEFTTYEGDALVTSGPLEDVQHLGTLSPFIPEEAPANADKPEEDVVSEETGKPSEQHPEEEETPSTVGSQHSEEPIYQDGTTETSVHAEAESEVPAALPEGTEGPSKLPEQDGAVQQQTQEETLKPIQEQPAPVDSDVPKETTVPLEDHEPVSPIKTDIPIESHVHEEISKPSEPITPDEAQKPEEETSKKDEETEKPINESETPVHPEQQLESTSEETLTFEHKPEEPAVTSPAEQIPEEPHTTAEEQTPPRLHVEPKPEEPQITSDEHEPPKADVESKPEVQITSDEHEPPKADAESKPEEPQITSDDHEPPEADTESKPEGPQITTHEQIPSKPEKTDLKPEEPHITSDDQLPTKVDAESKPEEPQISSDEQMLTKVEAELKPEEPHIIGNEQVQTEIKPEEPQVTSDEQAPPKVETDLKPEEPQTTIDEQKPSITDHEPQVTGESGEPSEVKPEEPHQPEQPQITSETTSLEQKPEEPLITTNIDTQPEATIEQKPDSIVPFTQDKVESQHHVTVAPDSVNELHSEHQTLTKPIEHIPGLYPEEDNNYGPLQVPGWTPKPYQPSEHTDEINQQEEHFPSGGDMDYELEEDGPFGPGTCRYGGKVYVSAQQIPRDDPCDFCFCFRSDIICLQQSCPPPIHRCRQESIKGFCCPRYECPVSMATSLNLTTTTTTTTTTLPPHFFAHAYKGAARRQGCQVRGKAYRVGEEIRSASGPCLQCICGADGQMKCDPKVCSPEPMLRKMMEEAISRRRR